jgi:phosphoglycerate dehydrogenase-like enzyme
MIGKEELARMKSGAGLISIARGAVLDFAALEDALRSGHLSGAVLNAFKNEPLPDTSSVWDIPNLIVTPHVGTQDRLMFPRRVLDVFFDNTERYLKGEPLQFQVDPKRGY